MQIEEKILTFIKKNKGKCFNVDIPFNLFLYDEYKRISLGLLNWEFFAKRGIKVVEITICFSHFIFSFVRTPPKPKEVEI